MRLFKGRKNRVIVIKLDNTYNEKMRRCDEGKFSYDNTEKEFEPKAVFEPEKQGFFRKKPKLILIGEKCKKAYVFNESMKGLCTHWSQKEAEDTVKKQMALSLIKLKPIEWNMVIVLLIPIGITLLLVLLMLLRSMGIVRI